MIQIDMEMPENCQECPLKMPCNYCEGYTDKCVIDRGNEHYVTAYENGRLPDCPLREVEE